MGDHAMLITDARELRDEVLIRKILECRRQIRELSAYRSHEVAEVTSNLAKVVAGMESEARRRELPIAKGRGFGIGRSIQA